MPSGGIASRIFSSWARLAATITLSLLAAAAVLTAPAAQAAPPNRLYVSDEILVQFRPGVSDEARQRAADAEGATIVERITPDGLFRLRLNATTTPNADERDASVARMKDAIHRWETRRDVEYASPNLIAHTMFVPNDTLLTRFDWTWNLRTFGAFDAWDVVTADPSIVIAIIDTGVATESHPVPGYEKDGLWPGTENYAQSPELTGPFLPGWDFVYDDAHPDDDHGHGTKVATIAVGAANNMAGSAGIAFGASLLPVKVVSYRDEAELDDLVQGIRFAADGGANIINMSLGLPLPADLAFQGWTQKQIKEFFKPVQSAVSYAQQRGSIIVAASGNDGVNAVRYPAAYPGVIAVGAAGVDSRRASYSNYSNDLDFIAPGGDFTDLNGDHFQDQIPLLSIKPSRTLGSLAKPDSFIVDIIVGTSAAAPHIAGAVALLMTLGETNQSAIERTLRESATFPSGLLRSQRIEYGNGFVHVDRAVQIAAAGNGPSVTQVTNGVQPEARVLSSNPARGETVLEYRVPASGRVTARVFDARGRLVRTLFEGFAQAGTSSVRWDGRDGRGLAAPSGIYFLRIDSTTGSVTHKVAFLR